MEVILSSTRAQVHFYAKLTGVIMVALAQLLAYAGIFAISYYWIKRHFNGQRCISQFLN